MHLCVCVCVIGVRCCAHSGPVSEGSIEGFSVWVKQVLDVRQTLHLELFGLFLNHLPVPNTHTHTTHILTLPSYHTVNETLGCVLPAFWSGVDVCVCVPHLCRADNRLLGLSSTGPMGSMVPLSLTQCR